MNIFEKIRVREIANKLSIVNNYPDVININIAERTILLNKVSKILYKKFFSKFAISEDDISFNEMKIFRGGLYFYIILKTNNGSLFFFEIYDSLFTDFVEVYFSESSHEDINESNYKKKMQRVFSFKVSNTKLSNLSRKVILKDETSSGMIKVFEGMETKKGVDNSSFLD